MANAYYSASLGDFLKTTPQSILGGLASNSEFDIDASQRDAWQQQISILKSSVEGLDGGIHMEFVVPRIGSRIDAVVISGSVLCVVEFKVGATQFLRADLDQAWDYALDLKNFHSASHHAAIVPILVATEAVGSDTILTVPHPDGVYPPLRTNGAGLRGILTTASSCHTGPSIDPTEWARAPYRPTPTIVEAAQALFAGHSVDSIARTEAGVRNLRDTSRRVEQVVEEAREAHHKAIIFVTGVPGAGKTLVGLNIATAKRDKNEPSHAVFLSGNGPLVKVLREALRRDAVARKRERGEKSRAGDAEQQVKAFIQNVHHFRDAGLNDPAAPSDHVVIFDEAQRAWDREMTADFMKRKKGRPGFTESEPEFLLSCMDRHPEWSVVICLVGGGQEINRGEAGISAWLEAVRERFPEWQVYISSELNDSEYAAGHALEALKGRANVRTDGSLHLAVSMRSFRAENVSRFVKAVLDHDRRTAHEILGSMLERYPVALTRNLGRAKQWVRERARGSERYGLVVSSGAQRLKPHAIDVRVDVNPVHWFLNDATDTRSSYYLEDAATEFQVQGLELDWTCVTWDADLRFTNSGWNYHGFRGSKWMKVKKVDRQQNLKNAYRVLLTRARQGMVICVPEGSVADPTRNPSYYDPTYEYLVGVGIPTI